MKIAQIEENLQGLVEVIEKETFLYEFLKAYGVPKTTIKRLQSGDKNLSKEKGEVLWKKKFLFREVEGSELKEVLDEIQNDPKALKHAPRFLVVTDYRNLLAFDTKTKDTLEIAIEDVAKHYDFFLPLVGMEKAKHMDENPADVKAAERMAKLFDEIKKDNPDNSSEFRHNLNVFLSRLLFCFFAEDTNIFRENQFTNAIASHTQEDGSDLKDYLSKLFDVLNTERKNRKDLPVWLDEFPYVNGGLFRHHIEAPVFTRRSRKAIIDSGSLSWSEINPDIFGSMIQAVVNPEERGSLGMHYTSVPNIMKVIEPLFLNELYEEFEKNRNSKNKLEKLLSRLFYIKIFDPACGSGNFLIIAYKELRKLEMKILKEIQVISDEQPRSFSTINLSRFYGIEIDDFAHEIAILSLWLAEHQMNREFLKLFGDCKPTLPLSEAGNVVQGNACRLSWEEVCSKEEGDEIYILGNPPYVGARKQEKIQKEDISTVFKGFKKYKNLDYIACWFYKGGQYIEDSNCELAFVSTNSICQGEQVELMWPPLLKMRLEIGFAYHPFKWSNNAKMTAGVTVIIAGLRNVSKRKKMIYSGLHAKQASNINPYLIDAKNVIISKRKTPISDFPRMSFGNMPNDGGHLILNRHNTHKVIHSHPEAKKLIRKLMGSNEFIKSLERWCLWISDSDLDFALSIPPIKERIELSKKHRLESKDKGTNKLAQRAHKFRDLNTSKEHTLIVPSVSSERRLYFPIGFLNHKIIVSNLALAIYDAKPYLMGLITSKIHNVWVRSIGGKLETRIRYSAEICYNNFPFPNITEKQKETLTQHVHHIIEEREKFSDKAMEELYDPDKMPDGLREAHHQIDLAVERCYRSKPFESDEERLEYLFKLYEKMIQKEKDKNGK